MASAGAIIAPALIFAALSLASKAGAIIISGSSEIALGNNVSLMKNALTNTTVGYGVPTANIVSGTNQTFAQFQAAISQTNSMLVTELHIYVATHGSNDGWLKFSDGMVPISSFVSAVAESSASVKYIALESCYSGLAYPALSAMVGASGFVITSSDASHKSWYWPGADSFFTSALADYMTDLANDSNGDGKVTYLEAFLRLLRSAGTLPNLGHPESIGIPTLSEWKLIFLTLLMLCLVMGFVGPPQKKFAWQT